MTPPAPPARGNQTHIAVLLAAAAAMTAILAARTSDLAGAAGSSWERAVRAQVKPSALRTENKLYAYGDPVTTATQYQTARIRADEYRRALARGGLTRKERQTLRVLAAAEESAAASLRGAAAADGNRLEGHGPAAALDVEGRLANEQRATLGAVADPKDVRAAGDSQSRHAVLEVLVAVPAALAFLLGSVAQARPQSAKRLLLAGGLVLSVSLALAIALEALLR